MEQLPFTALLNKYFGGVALALLHASAHPSPAIPKTPITNLRGNGDPGRVLLLVFFVLVRSRLSVETPGGLQHIVEGLHGFIQNQSEEIIGHHSERFTPIPGDARLCFILLCNLLGVVPGFESPTATPSVPLGCAIWHSCITTCRDSRRRACATPPTSWDPVWWLAWLMLPIELISHFARMLSLTIRLFANMFAGDMVTLVFFSLVPLGVPVAFLGLHIGVSLLQAYIFVLLTTVYLSGAVSAAH